MPRSAVRWRNGAEGTSALARPGWTINLVLGKRGDLWDVLEVGNVYPETLA